MKPSTQHTLRLVLLLSAVTTALFTSSEAEARVRLGLGANYWFDRGGLFDVTVAPSAVLSRNFEVGGRFGAFLATNPNLVGVPADLFIRGSFENLYVEALGGPWFQFEDDPVLGHAGFGFGLSTRSLDAGIEVGYLSPNPIAGLKLSFRL